MSNARHFRTIRLLAGHPNPIDVHVGARLRLRRAALGLSQEALGAALGLTFQQVQKYERGANRIGASRLFDLARALGVGVDYFYQDMGEEVMACAKQPQTGGKPSDPCLREPDLLGNLETKDLVQAYYRIGDPEIRRRVQQLAKALGTLPAAVPSPGE